jgi:hypothetical protein
VGVGKELYSFIISSFNGGEWLTLSTGRFIPGERVSHNHQMGGLLDPIVGLDDLERGKISCLFWDYRNF